MNQDQKNALIEQTIKALGTMVLFPQEVTNPDTFQKEVKGTVQRPILEGEDRSRVLKTLVSLITE